MLNLRTIRPLPGASLQVLLVVILKDLLEFSNHLQRRAALEYMAAAGWPALMRHEQALLGYGTELLQSIDGVRLVGTAEHKIGVLSFVVDGIHPHDLGTIADSVGVAIRTGHHCTQPLMERFGVPATARASLGLYNTAQDLEALAHAVRTAREMFGR